MYSERSKWKNRAARRRQEGEKMPKFKISPDKITDFFIKAFMPGQPTYLTTSGLDLWEKYKNYDKELQDAGKADPAVTKSADMLSEFFLNCQFASTALLEKDQEKAIMYRGLAEKAMRQTEAAFDEAFGTMPEDEYNKRFGTELTVFNEAMVEKSASEWIEEEQAEIKKTGKPTEIQLARIIAARQLADAKRGKRANIDSRVISGAELGARMKEVLNSQAFKDFFKSNAFKAKDLTSGHAGGFEEKFRTFVRGYDMAKLSKNEINRYTDYESIEKEDAEPVKAKENNGIQTYDDYIKKNAKDFGKEKNIQYLDDMFSEAETPFSHAAKMAAADHLRRKNPDAPFDEKLLNRTAHKFMADPTFKLMMRDKKLMDQLNKGNLETFALNIAEQATSFDGIAKGKIQLNYKPGFRVAREMVTGEYYLDTPEHIRNMREYEEANYERVRKEMEEQYNIDIKAGKRVNYSDYIDPDAVAERVKDQARRHEIETMWKKRGPKYKAMASTLIDYDVKKRMGIATGEDVVRVIGSIIDYQTGKEKGFKSEEKNQRFDESMKVLAELTVGTPAERYFTQQLDKVNAARGFKPGDPGYLKPENFLSTGTFYKYDTPTLDEFNRTHAQEGPAEEAPVLQGPGAQ